MASSPVASRLTQEHHRSQLRLSAELAAVLQPAWSLMDLGRLDESFDEFFRVVLPAIRGRHQVSARMARQYYRAFRAAEIGEIIDLAGLPAPQLDVDRLRTSLAVTGPIRVKQSMTAGKPLEKASQTALASVISAAGRHALSGGRQQLADAADFDDRVVGYARVLRGPDPCHFCALLASRGPVYKSEDKALYRGTGRKYHDGCNCAVEAVYSRDAGFPPGSEKYAAIYEETKQADPSSFEGTVAQEFRRRVEGRA